MRALLDTNAFLWFCADDHRLGDTARSVIIDRDNQIYLSVAAAWELSIKFAQQRVPALDQPPDRYVVARMAHYGFLPLVITMEHAFHAASLPAIHRDPFDRMMVAQAQAERFAIVTSDRHIAQYDVEVIW
ncbi:MAG: type II toxin-antitoxin system VapC family toxin [Dehalococcoidia bacterium]